MELCCRTVLEARSPKQGVGRATLPPKALEENPSLPLPATGVFLGLRPHKSNLCPCHHVAFYSVFLHPFLSLIRTPVAGFRAHLDLYLNYMYKDSIPKSGHILKFQAATSLFTGLGGWGTVFSPLQ